MSPSCLPLLLSLAAAPLLQDRDPLLREPPKAEAEAEKPEIVYLTEWPAPGSKEQLLKDIERVCKAHIPEMAVAGREMLVSEGAAAVPFVLERYGKERDEGAAKRLREILMEITAADQTRLLALEFEDKSVAHRTFALYRSAAFPDAGIRAPAEAAWERVEKQGLKADKEERYAAALCATSTGSLVGLPALHEAALKQWDKRGEELRAALEGVRGPEASAFAEEKLAQAKERPDRVAALRMLAGCGVKEAAGKVKPLLDETDNQVVVEAINALRGMVDGDPPIAKLAVFEAIEMAKKWKGRTW